MRMSIKLSRMTIDLVCTCEGMTERKTRNILPLLYESATMTTLNLTLLIRRKYTAL